MITDTNANANAKFSAFEQIIFNVLFDRAGTIVSRSTIEAAFSRLTSPPVSNSLEVLIGRIRKKLPPGTTIKSARKRGYVMTVIAQCDVCQKVPGTHTVLAAAGTETFVCNNCSPYKQQKAVSA